MNKGVTVYGIRNLFSSCSVISALKARPTPRIPLSLHHSRQSNAQYLDNCYMYISFNILRMVLEVVKTYHTQIDSLFFR